MTKRYFTIILFVFIMMLAGCDSSDSNNKNHAEMKYIKGFPEKMTPELRGFLRTFIEPAGPLVKEVDNAYIYSSIDIRKEPKQVGYSRINMDTIDRYFAPMLQTNSPLKTFTALKEKEGIASEVVAGQDYNLPDVTLDKNQLLDIRTKKAKKQLNLLDILKAFKVKAGNELSVKVIMANDQEFVLRIKNLDSKEIPYTFIFMKQDLSNYVTVNASKIEYHQAVLNGQLDTYKELIYQKMNKRFSLLNVGYGVIDHQTQKIKEVHKSDFLSQDGKYVYLGGYKDFIKDGEQYIQKTENYMAGNDKYAKKFSISYKKIAKELKLGKLAKVHHAKLMYFSEDFIVLRLDYKSYTADAGGTNVLIDLHNQDKPIAYLVDLDFY